MTNKKSIFISRDLAKGSPIRKVAKGHAILGKSLIDIVPIVFEMPVCDWLFFYSRNGVTHILNRKQDLSDYKLASIGSGTADALRKADQKIDFIGAGDADQITEAFSKVIKPEEKVCFIRANNSKNSIFSRIDCNNHFDLAVYDNNKGKDIPKEDFDILIFTSSMNAEAYFDHCEYKNQPCVAIGKPTANTLKVYNISDIIIAENASEASIASSLKMILK